MSGHMNALQCWRVLFKTCTLTLSGLPKSIFVVAAKDVGRWKSEKNTAESLKCWNLERVIDAELRKVVPSGEITLDEFVAKTEGAEVNEEI